MKKIRASLVVLVLALLSATVSAQTTVRIGGFGGIDVAIVNDLISEVIADTLEAEGIEAVYEPIEADYSTWLLNALSAGTAPDLFYVDIFFARSVFGTGAVAPLDDLLSDEELAEFLPNLVDAFTLDGSVYGVSKDFNTLAIQYNRDLFDEAGVEYPAETDTWESFEAKLEQVVEALGDVDGICVPADFARFGAFAYSTGWQPFNDEGHTDLDDNFRRAFEWYTGLVDRGVGVMPQDIGQDWTGGCLATEEVAASMEGFWVAGFLRDQAPGLDYGVTFMPIDAGSGERGNLIFTVSWSLFAGSDVTEEAVTVMQALTSPEAQQWVLERGLAIPSRAELADNPYFEQDGREPALARTVFFGAEDGYVHPYEFRGHGGSWLDIMNETLSGVLLGEVSVDDALTSAQQRLDQLTGR